MSLVETLVRVAVGSVLGFQSSLGAQNFLLRRQQSEADKERIYSPLYDEIAGGLELLESMIPSRLLSGTGSPNKTI